MSSRATDSIAHIVLDWRLAVAPPEVVLIYTPAYHLNMRFDPGEVLFRDQLRYIPDLVIQVVQCVLPGFSDRRGMSKA